MCSSSGQQHRGCFSCGLRCLCCYADGKGAPIAEAMATLPWQNYKLIARCAEYLPNSDAYEEAEALRKILKPQARCCAAVFVCKLLCNSCVFNRC